MSKFPPVAVIGQGCALPGALSPEELWEMVVNGRSFLGPVEGVDGLDDGLDPLFRWGVHAARQAMEGAGYDIDQRYEQAAVILGNKIYPTSSYVDLAEDQWRARRGLPPIHDSDPRNLGCDGFVASYIADAVGFGGPSYCLDVACASSLYAIDLACRALHRRDVDLMIAGGLNGADDQFLRAGFEQVGALSPTGRSRPFHGSADGLVPARGAAVVLLKRLDDALADGDHILGVIRGVGLSNDGRSQGFLPPCPQGQRRCMEAAYEQSGLDPSQLSLIECHAAGTARGDAVEANSLAEFFGDRDQPLPIASLKSNIGHAITVSGAAGLIKILCAIKHGVRPPTVGADNPIDELDGGPLRLLQQAEPWDCEGPRRAGINNFGFGGNNAHLIVEEFTGSIDVQEPTSVDDNSSIEVTALNALNAPVLDVMKLNFPPVDLENSLLQQRLIVAATLGLSEEIQDLDNLRTGVFIGMNLSRSVADHCLALRGLDVNAPELDPTRTMGCMPNLVTNRVNAQFDLRGQSLTIAADKYPGAIALELAEMAIRRGDLDAAIVGVVDEDEPRAAVMVLKKREPAGLAFVFTGPAGAYHQMGADLLEAMPELMDGLRKRCRRPERLSRGIYDEDQSPLEPAQKMWGSTFLSQIHAEFSQRVLGLRPAAVIGFCSGEMNALFAMGAWEDLDEFYDRLARESVFEHLLSRRFQAVRDSWNLADDDIPWQSWRIFADVEVVEEAVDGLDHCHLIIVNAPGDVVIGGTAAACQEARERLDGHRSMRLGYDVAMHCDAVSAIEEQWHELHRRPTQEVRGVRFYAHATLDHYTPDEEKVAQALVGQAMSRVDFPALIERAYADGIRVFIEHGPRAGCTRWISKILGDRPHLAVALDRRGTNSLEQAIRATVALKEAGVEVADRWIESLKQDALTILPEPPPLPPTTIAQAGSPPATSLIDAHHQFLATRSDLHRQFLDQQQRIAHLLAELRAK